MTVSRQFLITLVVAFSLLILFGAWLTYQFDEFSKEGARLTRSLQETTALSQELREGISEQMQLLYDQFEEPNPAFTTRFGEINFRLGERATRYLNVDIGQQERVTVESIRAMHAELGVKAFHVFALLQAGQRDKAIPALSGVQDLETRINGEFQALSRLQVEKLSDVLDQLIRSVDNGYLAIFGFTGSLFAAVVIFTVLMRRRILRPLHQLLQASEQLRRGDFSVNAPVQRLDEIGRLAQAFNFMAESLAESYASLEHKVEERTAQLTLMQQQLIRAEKMSAVGQLVSGVAHELNNPLTVVLGFAELAKRRLSAEKAEQRKIEMMDDIIKHADRCRRVVSNLLQFARQMEPHLEVVRINDLVEQVLELREYELRTRNIELVREYDVSNPALCADPHKLQQLVLNLLNNAHDALQEVSRPGKIWVRTLSDGKRITLEVLDNGTGVREPERVFDPFYTTKEVGKGTGLGLSVCYGIVEEHHGEIYADNWEQGARFTVRMPIGSVRELAEQRTQGVVPAKVKVPRRVLIVDDEEPILLLQLEYLANMGIRGHGVASGEEALAYLSDNAVDLIISDVRMPGRMDGLQLYEWVRANQPQLGRRFLFVSGDSIGMMTGEFFQENSIPCLQKPFKFEEYSQLVQQVLDN